MRSSNIATAGLCVFLAATAAPRDAHATYVKISEVMTGLEANPNVQVVILRFKGTGGPVTGYALWQFDSSGANTGKTNLTADVGNLQNGAPILIANRVAEQFFNITADFQLTGQPLTPSGALCLANATGSPDDCFIYGNAVQPTNTFPVGAGHVLNRFNPNGGITRGMVARRNYDSSNPNNNNSQFDFWATSTPWVENNFGAVGVVPSSTCGNGLVEGLESCDEGAVNGTAGVFCTSTCLLMPGAPCPTTLCATGHAVCGNPAVGAPVTEPSEECDDGNTINGDGCSATCRWEAAAFVPLNTCGNHILESPETCDPPDAGNVYCSATCQQVGPPAACGNGVIESPESCDPNDVGAPLPCGATCAWPPEHPLATCGNRRVETGERCDDGNTADGDGCSQLCQIETTIPPASFVCGDGILAPFEACDDGNGNGGTNRCKTDCQFVNPPVSQAPGGTTGTGSTGTGSTGTGTGTNTGGTATTTGTGSGGTSSTTAGIGVTGGTSSTTGGSTATTGGATRGATTGGTSPAPKAITCSNLGAESAWVFGSILAVLAWRRRHASM